MSITHVRIKRERALYDAANSNSLEPPDIELMLAIVTAGAAGNLRSVQAKHPPAPFA